ncbi:MAG: thioredoxin family protein, partial [bacterium]
MVLAVAAGFFCRAERTEDSSSCGEKEKVDWLDYDKAMARGAKEGKPIVLVFFQDHCRQCEMLDKKSFERPDIACYMNRKLVASRIHIKKEPELKKKYRVPGTPMVWFLTPEGEEIDYFVGYLKPAKVFSILHYIGD